MNKKILSLYLALLLMLSSSIVLRGIAAPAGRIYVDPTPIEFSTDPAEPNYRAVGDNFTVNIMAADFVEPGVYAYEFKLYYDNTILEATSVVLPEGHFLTPAPDEDPIFVTVLKVYHEEGYVVAAITSMGDVLEPKIGSGTLVTITFEITAAPPPAGVLSCDLEFRDVIFCDPDIITIEVTLEHGYYEYAAPKPPLPYLKVEPEFVSAKEVGDEVVVDITIQELVADWKAVGFQWKLHYNTTILETKGEWITEGDFLKQFGETFFWALQEDDYVISFTLYWEYPGPPTIFPEGSGTLATIRFNATYKPTFIDMVAECPLELAEVIIVDVDAEPIETRPEKDGFYQIAIAPPPWLSIEPDTYEASAIDDEFDLIVFINELEADWKMVGAEFKIRYNLTMLELTTIIEGGFMSFFADLSGTSTWFTYYVEEDLISGYGIVGVLILPDEHGNWTGPFPDTEDYGVDGGDLAIVTFKAIDQLEEEPLTSDIYLDEIILATTEATVIPYDIAKTAEEGICKYTITRAVPPWPPAAVIENGVDLFTQYGPDWGGMGLEQVSDAFPPQAVVNLNAYVTYHYDPVAYKPVSYLLIAPSEMQYFATVFTSENGLAIYNFSLPGSESGLWKVTASVDLGGTIYSDTLWFLEGWLVEAVNVEAPDMAKKGSTVAVTVGLTRICMQDPRSIMGDLLLHVTVTDELLQPVGWTSTSLPEITELSAFAGNYTFMKEFVMTIGNNWENRTDIILESYSDDFYDTVDIGIMTSELAFSGWATIRANVLTDFPGVAYCPEKTKEIWLEK